ARRHCRQAGVQLLDESVALTRLRPARGRWGRPGLRRRYAFEFTVTGERRYAGFVEMQGRHLFRVELAPHPFPGGKADETAFPPRLGCTPLRFTGATLPRPQAGIEVGQPLSKRESCDLPPSCCLPA